MATNCHTPLKKSESFKTVLPIRAADFMAWELRKAGSDRAGWVIPTEGDRDVVYAAYHKWAAEFKSQKGREPITRKSAWALDKAIPQSGYLWDEINIRAAHEIRHKNGWG